MAIQQDQVREELRRWGVATANRYARQWDGPTAGDNVLASFKVKPGTKLERQPVGRDGTDRRRLMAQRACAGTKMRLGVLPMWSCDPIRASNDADRPHERGSSAVDHGIPDELRWVDRALAAMARTAPMRANVIREEFTGTGTQRMKARRLELVYAGRLSVRQYRLELEKGLQWLSGQRAAA